MSKFMLVLALLLAIFLQGARSDNVHRRGVYYSPKDGVCAGGKGIPADMI